MSNGGRGLHPLNSPRFTRLYGSHLPCRLSTLPPLSPMLNPAPVVSQLVVCRWIKAHQGGGYAVTGLLTAAPLITVSMPANAHD